VVLLRVFTRKLKIECITESRLHHAIKYSYGRMDNIKYEGEVVGTKTQSNKGRNNLAFVCYVIQKFRKGYKCVPTYIQPGHGAQFLKSVLSRQNRDHWQPYDTDAYPRHRHYMG
jgi:hypothetical protein